MMGKLENEHEEYLSNDSDINSPIFYDENTGIYSKRKYRDNIIWVDDSDRDRCRIKLIVILTALYKSVLPSKVYMLKMYKRLFKYQVQG